MLDNYIIKVAVDSLLKWADGDVEKAKHLAETLASLDWHQAIIDLHGDKIETQMGAMESFLEWREEGGGFCDECEITKKTKYIGGYHHGPKYSKVYSWPHSISPNSYVSNKQTSGKLYCWQCLQKMQEQAEYHSLQWEKRMIECEECNRLIPIQSAYRLQHRKTIKTVQASYSIDYSVPGAYCIHCVKQAVEKQFSSCQECAKKTADTIYGYCYDCAPIAKAYNIQVSSHLERARKANVPATLTLRQWARTVAYFKGKCAYCRSRPFQVLEHFIPISLGGGTTEDNCIPACQKCNSKKAAIHPSRLGDVFPRPIINKIEDYLRGEETINESPIAHNRALVII